MCYVKLSRKRPDFEKTKNGSKAPGLKHYIGPGPQDLAQYYLPRKWGLDWMLQILVQNVVSHSVWPLIWYTICGHTIQNQIKWGKVVIFKKTCHMTRPGFVKIWILVADWSRLKLLEPIAGHVTRKIGPPYFKKHFLKPESVSTRLGSGSEWQKIQLLPIK